VTDLLPTEDAVLLAYIAKRTPGDQSTFDTLKPQIVESFKRQRGQQMFEEWKQYLLTPMISRSARRRNPKTSPTWKTKNTADEDSEQEE
jgi:hypothetical protein